MTSQPPAQRRFTPRLVIAAVCAAATAVDAAFTWWALEWVLVRSGSQPVQRSVWPYLALPVLGVVVGWLGGAWAARGSAATRCHLLAFGVCGAWVLIGMGRSQSGLGSDAIGVVIATLMALFGATFVSLPGLPLAGLAGWGLAVGRSRRAGS